MPTDAALIVRGIGVIGFSYGGLWAACFALQFWRDCENACKADDGVRGAGSDRRVVQKCRPTTAWDSCMEWKGSDEVCVSRCKFQQPCAVPAGVVAKYCNHNVECCSCCGGGTCSPRNCCRSDYHAGDRFATGQTHAVCLPAWDGQGAPALAVPEPTPDAGPGCKPYFTEYMSSWDIVNDGGGPKVVLVSPRPCKCWYSAKNEFTHDEPKNCNAKFTCGANGPQSWMNEKCR
jgi:hypothetical protein